MRGMQNLRREETKIRRHKLKKFKKGGADLVGSCGEHPTHNNPGSLSHTSNGEDVILLSPAEPVALETEGTVRCCLSGLTFSGHD